MKFFIMFLEVPDFSAIKDDLIRFKQNLQRGANVTVIDIEQTNYDFLYNSLIEKANDEKRRGVKDALGVPLVPYVVSELDWSRRRDSGAQ